MHQVHNNENGYAWQLRGRKRTKKVKSNTGRRRLNIIGALDPISLEPIVILTEANCNRDLVITFLKHIREQNKEGGKIYIILDNARYNKSNEVKEESKLLNIELIFLPAYSPNLNLIERLWRFFKKEIMKNHYYQTFDEFYQKVSNFFKDINIYREELESLLTLKFGIL